MTEGPELERIRLVRGNELLPLDDPGVSWRVESGGLGVFAASPTAGGPAGRRRFLFEVGPGEMLFGIGPTTKDRPGIVAVAIEECRLSPIAGAAAGAEAEGFAVWCGHWRKAVGFPSEGATPVPDSSSSRAFHEELLQHLATWAGGDERSERERFEQAELRSREMTREAVGELTSVLAARSGALPPGSELFLAAHLVGRAGGIRLRQPPRWREVAWRGDPVDLIAAASHVRTRRVLLHDGWTRQDCGPLLAFTSDERRPLALLPLGPGKYEVFDPATRRRIPLDAGLAAGLDPQAHMFYRPLPDEATSGIGLLRFALHGRSRDLLALLGGAAAATLLGMVTPQATALLVDHAIADADVQLIRQLTLALLAAALGGAAFRFAQGVATIRLETSADLLTQSAVWDRLLNLQLSFFRRFSTGDLLSRVTAVSQIRAYLSGTALRTLFSSVAALLNLGLLLYYSPTLTLVALAVAAASTVLTVVSGWMILRCYREILELKGRFFGLLVQLIHGVSKLRVAAAEERAFSRWARVYARLARLELRQRWLQDHVQLGNLALTSISMIVLFAVAASLVSRTGMEGTLTTGVFLAFSVAFGTFIAAISGLSNTITDVMAIAILRERARPILEETAEVNEHKADPGRLEGGLRIEHVVFQYREEGPVILDDVSVRARPGEFVALVGPSGSGKSTLLRLILGFETAQSGSIFFDGQDLGGLDVFAIRRQLGVVLQQGRINSGSLFENIVCGTQVTLDDAWESARSTGFSDEIEAMPMGMHTVISEGGTNLSGGQRQRLLLTRALVHRPRMLLLDEATSALDNRTQAVVSESLARLAVTRIVVAHRLSTIRRADRIYVVESGRVAQRGTFEELSSQDGLFARLMARQMT